MKFIITKEQLQEVSMRIAKQMTWEQANPIMVILDQLELVQETKADELAN